MYKGYILGYIIYIKLNEWFDMNWTNSMTVKELIEQLQLINDQNKIVAFVVNNDDVEIDQDITIFDGEPIIDKESDFAFISIYN